MTPERCSIGSLRRGDPIGASAPPAHHWVLIERPGPWGVSWESALPAVVAESVAAQAKQIGARVLLIRRHGRSADRARRWALVDARRERLWWNEFHDPTDLLDLRLTTPRGDPSTEPAYLVCAHGKHDTCCAIRGRPVAAALAVDRPDQTWECSHVGGDRFAANLLVLPHGFYFGQVEANQAPRIATDFESGLLDLSHLRGRSTYSAPAQAAQHFARERWNIRAIDALTPISVRRTAHEQWDVELTGPVYARVQATFTRSDTPLTCRSTVPAAIRQFILLSLR